MINNRVVNKIIKLACSCTSKRYINGTQILIPRHIAHWFKPFFNISYEKEEWTSLMQFGKLGGTFIDIGANIGIITVAMARKAGTGGKVIAFEPHPEIYVNLRETLSLNDCNNVQTLQCLVMDKTGIDPFYLSSIGALGACSSAVYSHPGSSMIKVPAITLDSFCQDEIIPDYIKIDAEGAELRILSGAKNTLIKARPLVQVEVHGQYITRIGDTVEGLFEFMDQLDYICVNLVTLCITEVNDFMRCTNLHVKDIITGIDLSTQSYGQVLFVPKERDDLIGNFYQAT